MHIVGTVVVFTTVTGSGDGQPVESTEENIRDAAELAGICLRNNDNLEIKVLLSDGSARVVTIDMREVGA
jgi:hypothetical protein